MGERIGAPYCSRMLRGKSAAEMQKVQGAFRPSVDGWFLPEDAADDLRAQDKQSDVLVIAGYNHDESRTLQPWPAGANMKTFLDQTHQRYGDFTDEFQPYLAGSDEQAAEAHYTSTRDQGMGCREMRGPGSRSQTKTGKSFSLSVFLHADSSGSERG